MDKPTVYDQHDKAFAKVSAYIVVKDGERIATIAFKFPTDGAGRLHCYLHWLGIQMVRGWAGGFGYDKLSAAVADACKRLPALSTETYSDGVPIHSDADRELFDLFRNAAKDDNGWGWDRRLTDVGFTVWQAV